MSASSSSSSASSSSIVSKQLLGKQRSSQHHVNLEDMRLVYGTAWKKEDTARLVAEAIAQGFRYIDTASQTKHYNEAGVGQGWTEACRLQNNNKLRVLGSQQQQQHLTRSDIWLQSKFSRYKGDPSVVPYDGSKPLAEQVQQSFQIALSNLRTEYLDAYILHSPYSDMEQTRTVWASMESLVDAGLVRYLGMSNFYDVNKFQVFYDGCRIKPRILQNRFHAKTNFDVDLRKFCKKQGIVYQSFWTLTANRKALASSRIEEMAKRKNLESPQLLMYAFMLSHGHAPLDGTSTIEHMAEDIALENRIKNGQDYFADANDVQIMSRKLGIPDE